MNDARTTGRQELVTLVLLGSAFGIAFFDRSTMSFLAPFVAADLHLRNVQIGALASALSVSWALGAYLIGRWSDAVGRRKPFLLSAMAIFSLCSVLSGFASNFASLFVTRLIMGAAEGPFLPICLAIMTAASAPTRRGLNAGVVQNVFGSLLGNALCPIVVVAVAQALGWRAAFYWAGLPGILCALLIWRYVAEPPPMAAAAPEDRAEAGGRMTLLAMLGHRNILLCNAISCFMVGTLVLGSIFLPLYLIQVRGFSPATMGWVMAALGLAPVAGGVIVPALSDRIGRRPPMIAFCFLAMLCPLAALYFPGGAVMLAALMFVGWIGAGVFPLFMGIVPAETLGAAHAATAMGLVVAVGELTGGVFAPLVGGWAADRSSLAVPLLIQAGVAALAGLLAIQLRETNPRLVAQAGTRLAGTD